MLDVCLDAVFESTGVLATQWSFHYTYLQKSTKSKNRFDDFHRRNPRFSITGNVGIIYSYI